MINEIVGDYEEEIKGDDQALASKRIIYSSPAAQENLRKFIPIYAQMETFDL